VPAPAPPGASGPEKAPYEARLRALEHRLAEAARGFERERDSRCVFTHAYALMTRLIAKETPRTPGLDGVWIADLAEAFAERYFAALADETATASEAWRDAFKAMRDKRTSVIEDLVFAMEVHIVHDLPLALEDMSSQGSLGHDHIDDYHAVNGILASSIRAIVNSVARRYSPYIRWLDRLGRPYDLMITDSWIRISRGLAWYDALRLADGRAQQRARREIERSPVEFIDDVVNPPNRSLRALFRVLRWVVSFLRTWPREGTQRGMDIRPTSRTSVPPSIV
jgi:hypothetical protein